MAKTKATREAEVAEKSGAEAVEAAPAPAQPSPKVIENLGVDTDKEIVPPKPDENKDNPLSDGKPEASKMLTNAIARTVKEMAIDKLKHHPLSDKIYSRKPGKELIASILQHGILQPVLVAQDTFEIIAGNSRVEAARILGIPKVPVTLFTSDDPLEISQAVLETNNQRVKTEEQKIREFVEWLEIEKMLAKRRMSTRQAEGEGVKNSPQPEPGKARDKAAEKIGISGVTAEKGAAIVKAADGLKARGEAAKAVELLAVLNAKNINAAYGKGVEMGVLNRSEGDGTKTGKKAVSPKQQADPKSKPKPKPPADFEPSDSPVLELMVAKISNHDEALVAVDKVTDFVRAQDGNKANKGRTTEWKEAIEVLVDSLKAVGIKVA